MADKRFNENILEQIRHGIAKFELVSSPLSSISTPSLSRTLATAILRDNSSRFFARIGPSLKRGGGSPATKKVEHFSVHKFTGMAAGYFEYRSKGWLSTRVLLQTLGKREMMQIHISADELRMAVKEVLCDSGKDRQQYEEALVAITVEESFKRYCQCIQRPDFWGGESELLVLSRLCGLPTVVYIPEHEHTKGGQGTGFIPIAEYGSEFHKGSRKGKPRKVVRLLYSGRNHCDQLVSEYLL